MNPTTTEHTKAVARRFFERYDANDIEGAAAMLTDDVRYWLAGKPELMPVCGMQDKAQITEVFRRMTQRLRDGQRMKVIGLIAEGPQAAVEVESEATLLNGRAYRNQYHFLITVRGEGICAVKEYFDTQHVHAVWFQR